MSIQHMEYDVAIIGGGPAGSTAGTLLRKYAPEMRVAIFERERFPRDHVGESLLPTTSSVLYEMGAWDEIEKADFPVKIGATYKWGRADELWDFNFLAVDKYQEEQRPAPYAGQRVFTSFQEDRSIYDDILLKRAAQSGCDVHQETQVSKVLTEGNRVTGLQLSNRGAVAAQWYLDASGHSGILRRALGVEEQINTSLKNIAIWDYWQNAEWAVHIGVGGTRIQVLSLGFGWIWFIPLGPTRTSVGLVVPASYYKESAKRPEELYLWALQQEPRVAALLKNATSENHLFTTRDWSFVASQTCGQNWFLVGESAGFADPILSAGVTMAHMAARECAYTIVEIGRGQLDRKWLKSEFDRRQKTRVNQHIRFADYWYAGNGLFSELQEFTETIADDVGLRLSPAEAWDWIARGGFVDEDTVAGTSFFSLRAVEAIGGFITGAGYKSPLELCNVFELNLKGAEQFVKAQYQDGRIIQKPGYRRDGKVLPLEGTYKALVQILTQVRRIEDINTALNRLAAQYGKEAWFKPIERYAFQALEALVNDGWVKASFDPNAPVMRPLPKDAYAFQLNTDESPN